MKKIMSIVGTALMFLSGSVNADTKEVKESNSEKIKAEVKEIRDIKKLKGSESLNCTGGDCTMASEVKK